MTITHEAYLEERAENLSPEELDRWTAPTPRDKAIIRKLTGPGAKLLIGPRGSGKSTYLRKAYFELLEEGEVLTAYVNYARSLALEPLFHKSANALQIFREWVLFKIILGLAEGETSRGREVAEIAAWAALGREFVRKLELGQEPPALERMITPTELLGMIERWTRDLGYRRCVLLMDDAAHAFSSEQQKEFFEIFRGLRSGTVAGKAAVYPGITSYSPFFHVGHEAEMVEVWLRPDEAGYRDVMRAIVTRRFPAVLAEQLAQSWELVDLLAYASFGIPRGFLGMVSQLVGIDEDDENATVSPTRRRAESAVKSHAETVTAIFQSLAQKLPRFKHFVEVGIELQRAMLENLSKYNRQKPRTSKAVLVGLREPLDPEIERMLQMLEYSGAMRRFDSVSRGEKGSFLRVMVHYAHVLDSNALSLGRSPSVAASVEALESRDAHEFTRTSARALLGTDYQERATLDLAPCPNCGAPRISEEAQFCMVCGTKLSSASVYEDLLHTSIEVLPLTNKKRDGILQHTRLRTIQDVLLDEESAALRSVPYIGPVWTKRIRTMAEEFVSV